jgi:hypothetical protein
MTNEPAARCPAAARDRARDLVVECAAAAIAAGGMHAAIAALCPLVAATHLSLWKVLHSWMKRCTALLRVVVPLRL